MDKEYQIIYFKKGNGRITVFEYIEKLSTKDQVKIFDYINSLSFHPEFRKEPFSRHLSGKLRELKVDFSHNRHRIIYFFRIEKIIILLHAFKKKTNKTPTKEIAKAKKYMQEYLDNK